MRNAVLFIKIRLDEDEKHGVWRGFSAKDHEYYEGYEDEKHGVLRGFSARCRGRDWQLRYGTWLTDELFVQRRGPEMPAAELGESPSAASVPKDYGENGWHFGKICVSLHRV